MVPFDVVVSRDDMSATAEAWPSCVRALKCSYQFSYHAQSYLDELKSELSEATFVKPRDNLTKGERKALKNLKTNTKINLTKADKGTTTVTMNKEDK